MEIDISNLKSRLEACPDNSDESNLEFIDETFKSLREELKSINSSNFPLLNEKELRDFFESSKKRR